MARKRVNLTESGDDWENKERQKAMAKGQSSDESKRPENQKAASYRIGQDAIDRLNDAAKKYNVLKGDLARFLILTSLDLLESGEISFDYVENDRPKRIDF